MIIGIDPGKHIGIAAICDGMTLSAKTINIENLISVIEAYLITFPADRMFLRIGDQPPSVSRVIFNKLYNVFQKFDNLSLEIVKEASSNVKTSLSQITSSMDENAAINISFREGKQKNHMVRNDDVIAEIREEESVEEIQSEIIKSIVDHELWIQEWNRRFMKFLVFLFLLTVFASILVLVSKIF